MNPFLLLLLPIAWAAPPPLKREYIIGGWAPGDIPLLMRRWAPVFQTHLTRSIGPLYDPPIAFKLIPVDYSKQTLAMDLIRDGQALDFVCRCCVCSLN